MSENPKELVVYGKSHYGWFIRITPDDDRWDEMQCLNIPEELFSLMKLAKENNCVWLELDIDGPILEHLPLFEW